MNDALAIVLAIIASMPGLMALAAQRRKNAAEVTSIITESVMSLLEPKDKYIAKLEKQNADLLAENERLMSNRHRGGGESD